MGSVIVDLANHAGITLRYAAGLELVPAREAEAFVDACIETGTRILGIEGFEVSGDVVRPDMDAIADFSALSDARTSADEARQFLSSIDAGDLAFEFVLAEDT